MNSKQRVLTAMNHEEPDRVPLDIGSINNSSMYVGIEKQLKEKLNLRDNGTEIKSYSQLITIVDDSILDYFDADTRSIYFDEAHPWIDNKDGTYTDMWGIRYKLNRDGYYYNMIGHPLEYAKTIEDIKNYELPKMSKFMIDGLRNRCLKYSDKCLVLEGMREVMFGLPSWLRRNDNFYIDLLLDEGLDRVLLDKLFNYHLKRIDYVMNEIGDLIDVFKFADDLGTQTSTIISPSVYREKIKPYHKGIVEHVKSNWDVKVLLHTDGAISSLIPDFIEIGIDAINPVQITAAGMDPKRLKSKYGKNITFWGGGCDTQHVLGVGTVEEVKKDVKKNVEMFKPGGGYVFTQVHNIQADVPVENVIAMWESFHECAKY